MQKQIINKLMTTVISGFASLLLISSPLANAAKVTDFVPLGQVQLVDSVQITFDTAVAPFGSSNYPSPIKIKCSELNVSGNGRWLDQNRFTYVFDQSLDADISCVAELMPNLMTLNNEVIQGEQQFLFSTGNPRVIDVLPYGYYIDEDQVFVLKFNGKIDAQELLKQSYCAVDGIGEQIPAKIISDDSRLEIIANLYSDFTDNKEKIHLIQCARNLPANTDVQVFVGKSTFDYQVRDNFKATLSCQRENARANCLPITDIDLYFSANVDIKHLKEIRLKVGDEVIEPTIDADDSHQSYVSFKAPFPPDTELTINLPEQLVDDANRDLINLDQFPLVFKTANYPPLVKFASGNFGVIERFAASNNEQTYTPTVPLSLRNVQANLLTTELNISSGVVNDHIVQNDKEVINWYGRLKRLNHGNWTQKQIQAILNDQQIDYQDDTKRIDVRAISVLANQIGTKTLNLPGYSKTDLRPFEVIGVPVPEAGLHIIEVQSPILGQSLIENGSPMYVRTMALVTNLSVHLKSGRDDLLVWVTTLEDAKPVPDASINVLDCNGNLLANGVSDMNGLLHIKQSFETDKYCAINGLSGIFASAQIPKNHPQAKGQDDYAFVFSSWDDGIESWRFNVSTDFDVKPTTVLHTVLDRNLLRAGETLSMKHFIRTETRDGLGVIDKLDLPNKITISHYGSNDSYTLPVQWQSNSGGGLWAVNEFEIPVTAKLGNYYSYMNTENNAWYDAANFSVQEFKLPVFSGYIQLNNKASSHSNNQMDAAIQIGYLDGGPASNLETYLSVLSENAWLYFSDYSDYSFNASDNAIKLAANNFEHIKPASVQEHDVEDNFETESINEANSNSTLVINKQKIILDATGGANVKIHSLDNIVKAQNLIFELSFADPNGQIQTISQYKNIWSAGLQVGIKAPSWSGKNNVIKVKTLAIDSKGDLHANADISIRAVQHKTYSTRKRLVGGFYSYDSHEVVQDLGAVCSGKTDKNGYLYCNYTPKKTGYIELIAKLTDANGFSSYATSSVWVSGGVDNWFGGNDDDRIDIIPAQKTYKPGDLAQFQVLMPYKQATALVSVEREGVLATYVQHIDSSDPMVRIKIKPEWGPNVYVSVLAVRSRIHELLFPDSSDFNWHSPQSWVNTIRGLIILNSGSANQVDLAKPSFKFGLTNINVTDSANKLNVQLTTNQKNYQVGSSFDVEIVVTNSDGSPASNGTIAFAGVDQALLELSPNNTWDLLSAMYPERSYGVKTATAQMHIVGRRHYGRKAVPAGGGGGKSPTRELLDTLLIWQPNVQLDEKGRAIVKVKLNDAITKFALVAIADYGLSQFGTGITYVNSTRDLQIIPGLPAQVRMGDMYQAQVTLRNTTDRDMQVQLNVGSDIVQYGQLEQLVDLKAGQSDTVKWNTQLDYDNNYLAVNNVKWQFDAKEVNGPKTAFDSLTIKQNINPVVPVQVQQSASYVLNAAAPNLNLDIKIPKGSIVGADNQILGGLDIGVSKGPITNLDNLKHWFDYYDFFSLEFKVSKAIIRNDANLWQQIIAKLPTYIDEDGLAKYYPNMQQGNEVLTAYILSAAYDAYDIGQPFNLSQQQTDQMVKGLINFITGKIRRDRYAPKADLDVRKLLALDAVSRYTKIPASALDSIKIDPDNWTTAGVIAWLSVLQTVQGLDNRTDYIQQATNILKARMLQRGSSMVFANSTNNQSSWLMTSTQSNQARLILATKNLPQWHANQHLLLQGLISMQRWGSWQSSTANTNAYLAINGYLKGLDAAHEGSTVLAKDSNGKLMAKLSLGKQDKQSIAHLSWSHLINVGTNKIEADNLKTNKIYLQHSGHENWLRVTSLAAVENNKTIDAGFKIKRTVIPVSQKTPNKWSVGDIYRVKLEIDSRAPMSWVAIKDAVPPGGSILGTGLANDSLIASLDYDEFYYQSLPSYIENRTDSFNAFYEYLFAGTTTLQYTVRLNTPGIFKLPATRVNAIYEPDVYGESPILSPLEVSATN